MSRYLIHATTVGVIHELRLNALTDAAFVMREDRVVKSCLVHHHKTALVGVQVASIHIVVALCLFANEASLTVIMGLVEHRGVAGRSLVVHRRVVW